MSGSARRAARTLVLLGLVAAPAPAGATWSIVAVDRATREVGVAGASCHPGVEVIGRVVPGRGAVAAQALANLDGRDHAAARLAEGARPEEILAELRRRRFDKWFLPLHRLRQYGIASLDAPAASYTGAWTVAWKGAAQGDGVTVQGNLLRGPEVVRDALAAFEGSAARCGLAERLLRALEAGAAAGGDRRCSIEQTALSAFLVVARPADAEAAPSVRLAVPAVEAGGANPVERLRHELDGWRALHPETGC